MFRGCGAEHYRKQPTDGFRTYSGAIADTGGKADESVTDRQAVCSPAPSSPIDETPDNPGERKKKKRTTLKMVGTWK